MARGWLGVLGGEWTGAWEWRRGGGGWRGVGKPAPHPIRLLPDAVSGSLTLVPPTHRTLWVSYIHCASMTSCIVTMPSFSDSAPDRTRRSSCM
jgi:hypothetical protein